MPSGLAGGALKRRRGLSRGGSKYYNTLMRTTLSGLILRSSLLLLAAAPLAAQVSILKSADSELLNYIRGENADPACGVCLGAARRHSEEKARERIAKKTTGMAFIAGGPRRLGSPDGVGDPDERPAAEINLSAFYLDRTEATIAEYTAFARAAGGNYPEWLKPEGKFNILTGSDKYYRRLAPLINTCGSCPVFGVTWENAQAYCRAKKKRLPTEAEWEAAARAGSDEAYSFGASTAAEAYAWVDTNSGETPHPVGTRKPNAYGLSDMHGNVWEWVADLYGKTCYAERRTRNPQGPEKGQEHVIRGGSWAGDVYEARSANRAGTKRANDDIGFRCAVSETELTKESGL